MNQEYLALYIDFLKKHISLARPMTVVCDSSNGTTGPVLKQLTNIPNLTLILINDTPDGDFPAHGANPLEPGATDDAAKKVIEAKADFGVIFDADGDRAFFVDDKGETLLSHMTSILLFRNAQPPFVADELVYQSLKHMNVFKENEIQPSKIGTYYVKEVMHKTSATTAAEYSGHYYFKDFFGTDSGIFAMIQVMNTLSRQTQTLTEFNASLPSHRLYNENPKIEGRTVADVIKHVEGIYKDKPGVTFDYRDGMTIDFGDKWVSVRGSNTEPVLRLIAGSKSDAESVALVHEIKVLL